MFHREVMGSLFISNFTRILCGCKLASLRDPATRFGLHFSAYSILVDAMVLKKSQIVRNFESVSQSASYLVRKSIRRAPAAFCAFLLLIATKSTLRMKILNETFHSCRTLLDSIPGDKVMDFTLYYPVNPSIAKIQNEVTKWIW